jgi:hypothetical protein
VDSPRLLGEDRSGGGHGPVRARCVRERCGKPWREVAPVGCRCPGKRACHCEWAGQKAAKSTFASKESPGGTLALRLRDERVAGLCRHRCGRGQEASRGRASGVETSSRWRPLPAWGSGWRRFPARSPGRAGVGAPRLSSASSRTLCRLDGCRGLTRVRVATSGAGR